MRADILSKRLFLAGCFGLPWLWCVHVMYWYIKSSKSPTANPEEDHVEALLNADSEDYHDEPGDPEEVTLEEKKWIRRSFVGSVLATIAWTTWIIIFHVMKDSMSDRWFIRIPDQAEFTGW